MKCFKALLDARVELHEPRVRLVQTPITTSPTRLNPFPPSVSICMASFSETFNLILEGIIKKISYECRDYESADEESQS